MKATNIEVTKDLIAQHNLSDDEYKKIVEILGREPNLTELGMFSVMWSEHCSYKSFARAFAKVADDGTASGARTGGKCGRGGHRRWLVRGVQDGIAQPSVVHRAVSRRRDGGRGDSARHLYDGGAAVALLDSLRFGLLDQPLNRHLVKGVVAGISWLWQLHGRADDRRRNGLQRNLLAESARECVLSRHCEEGQDL